MIVTALDLQRKQYVQTLETALENIVVLLSQMPDVQRVILFGSYAAGRRDLLTDLDLLVVMESDQGFIERVETLYRHIHPKVALDLLVYTPDEIQRNQDNPFFRSVLMNGQVMYEKNPA